MSLQKLTRISVLVTKKDGVSYEEFHRYWADKHAPLVQKLLVRHGIVKYTQFHITPEHKALGAAVGSESPYDGIAEFLVHRYSDMESFFADPEYMATIRPDEAMVGDVSKMLCLVGADYVVIDDNKYIPHEGPSAF